VAVSTSDSNCPSRYDVIPESGLAGGLWEEGVVPIQWP